MQERAVAVTHVPHPAAHAMEPVLAVAPVTGNPCEVWAPTQNPQAHRPKLRGRWPQRCVELPQSVTEPDIAQGIGRFYPVHAIAADAFAISQPEDVDINESSSGPRARSCEDKVIRIGD
jgi:hypothetical protein